MISEKKVSVFQFRSMGAYDLGGVANLDPRGMVCRVYVGNHQTLLHTIAVSSASWFQRRRVLKVL